MRVEDRPWTAVAAAPRRVAGAFTLPGTAPVEDALQGRGERRRDGSAARRHAETLLDAMGAVQRAVLAGDESAAAAALEALALAPAPPAEPALAALLAAIRLRARVTALQCRERCRATPWRVSNTLL